MATTKVGVYRKYHGPVLTDDSGKPLPKGEWPSKRVCSWAVRWFGSEGNRFSKSFKTRKEAERFAEEKQAEVRAGRADPPPDVTLREFIQEHKRVMRGQIARESLKDQLRALRMFMDHVGKNTLLREITPRHAESFVSARLASKVSVATVNKDIRTLKRVFNLAMDPRGYLREGQNPLGRIKQRKQAPRTVRYVTAEEVKAVLDAAEDTWWRALILLACTTGARLGEIIHLTWPDVDFEENRIRIAGKTGGADGGSWEPKDHEGRVLPAPAEVLLLLADLQVGAEEGRPYVFVPNWRWRYIRRAQEAGRWDDSRALMNNLNRRLATLRKRAGVAKFTFHDLRRTCITNWARHLPVHVVLKLAGHSDIKTTQRYYLSVQEDDLEKARVVQSEVLGFSGLTQK